MNNQGIRGALPVLASVIAAVLVGCGGGGGDASPPPAAPPPSLGGGTGGTGAQAPVVSSGTMVKGSIILNGIRYDDSATTVTDDRNRTAAQLANGMAIKLRGRSDDNVTGHGRPRRRRKRTACIDPVDQHGRQHPVVCRRAASS